MSRLSLWNHCFRTYGARGSTYLWPPSKRRVHRSVTTIGSGWNVLTTNYDNTRTRRQIRRQLEPYGLYRSYQSPNVVLPQGLPSHPLLAEHRSSLCLTTHSAHRRPSALARAVRRYHAVALSGVPAQQPKALNQSERAHIAGLKLREDTEIFLWRWNVHEHHAGWFAQWGVPPHARHERARHEETYRRHFLRCCIGGICLLLARRQARHPQHH